MSDSNSLVHAVWTADLSGCYRLSEMHCKHYVEINPNARGFPFDEINRWDIRKVIQRNSWLAISAHAACWLPQATV